MQQCQQDCCWSVGDLEGPRTGPGLASSGHVQWEVVVMSTLTKSDGHMGFILEVFVVFFFPMFFLGIGVENKN